MGELEIEEDFDAVALGLFVSDDTSEKSRHPVHRADSWNSH